MDKTSIGIIGLGHIGLALAGRLVESGRVPTGYRRGDRSALIELGGIVAASVEELAATCDTIFLVLPDIAASALVIDRLLELDLASLTIIDVTSQPPANAVANGRRASAAGHLYVEAPVSGSPPVVAAGNGQFFVGAEAADFARVRPLLADLAVDALHVGRIGSASALKSAALLMMAVNILGLAEGLAYATSFGVEPAVAIEALQSGPAASAAMRHRGPWMATGEFDAKLGRMADFKGLLQGIGQSATTRTDMLDRVLHYIEEGVAAGIGDEDIAGLFALVRNSGAS